MRAQHWKCNFCMHMFYWIIDVPRFKRPNCPNCHAYKSMQALGMVQLSVSSDVGNPPRTGSSVQRPPSSPPPKIGRGH